MIPPSVRAALVAFPGLHADLILAEVLFPTAPQHLLLIGSRED